MSSPRQPDLNELPSLPDVQKQIELEMSVRHLVEAEPRKACQEGTDGYVCPVPAWVYDTKRNSYQCKWHLIEFAADRLMEFRRSA